MDSAPLPALDAAYHSAKDGHNDTQAKEIRDIVIKRMKSGEWKTLDPATKTKLAPFIRELGMS
jgi:hypothetical protein